MTVRQIYAIASAKYGRRNCSYITIMAAFYYLSIFFLYLLLITLQLRTNFIGLSLVHCAQPKAWPSI